MQIESTNRLHRSDNFDFLRIGAAFMVLASHQAPVTGRSEWGFLNYHSLGGVGVLIFFVTSGFLVCQSWMNDPNIVRFGARRLLRIWPGLAAVTTICIFALGPVFTSISTGEYFRNPTTWHYLVFLKFDLAGTLPGVFEANPIRLVNSSMWTIPIELRWYWILMGLGVIQVIRLRSLLLIGTFCLAAHYFFFPNVEEYLASGGRRGWKEEFGLFFLAGACLARYRNVWESRRLLFLSIATACFVAGISTGHVHLAFWVALPILVIFFGTLSVAGLNHFGKYGDLSYGTYLYAFPVQQCIVTVTDNSLTYIEGLVISAAITLVCAFLSWHLVEKPCLKLKPGREGFKAYFRRFDFSKPVSKS